MEYRRRRNTRHGKKRRAQSSGNGSKTLVITLVFMAAAIYIISVSSVGTWLSKKVVAPIFSAFSGNSKVEPEPTDNVGGNGSIFTSGAQNSVTEEIRLPAMNCYLLQMGVFESEDNASAAAADISTLGAAGYVFQEDEIYRVFFAGYKTEAEAKSVRDRLRSENVECTVHGVSTPELTFSVTASQEQIDILKNSFDTLIAQMDEITELTVTFDKDSMSIAEAKVNLQEICDELSVSFEAINSRLESAGEALTPVISCYSTIIDAYEEIYSYGDKNTVDFSAKMKYTQLLTVHEYMRLAETLYAH